MVTRRTRMSSAHKGPPKIVDRGKAVVVLLHSIDSPHLFQCLPPLVEHNELVCEEALSQIIWSQGQSSPEDAVRCIRCRGK